MTDPDTIITTMAQQREQERAQDEAHYKLRKACQARAVELYSAVRRARDAMSYTLGPPSMEMLLAFDQLLKEIDDASH